jgi:hypothetical protein
MTTQQESMGNTRRGLIRLLAAGGAGATAAVLGSPGTAAASDDTNALQLGQQNTASAGTELIADQPNWALLVRNPNSDGMAFAIQGVSKHSDGIHGDSEHAHGVYGNSVNGIGICGATQGTSPNAGVRGTASGSGDAAGVQGYADTGFGVYGWSQTNNGMYGQSDTGCGVQGSSRTTHGVRGHSDSGVGVEGVSETGVGGHFRSNGTFALQVEGAAALVNVRFPGTALDVTSTQPDGNPTGRTDLTGICGNAKSEHRDARGVQGVSSLPGDGEHFGDGSGVGVQGVSGTGIAVEAISQHGLALAVRGRAHFETSGRAVVPKGANSVFVSNPVIDEDSHVSVTLTSDPGGRQISWVERQSGRGFTVHFSGTQHGPRPRITLTYLIVDLQAEK